MIVQPGERNSIDQRWLQYTLFERYGIKLFRKSLLELETQAILDEATGVLTIDGHEVAVAYFRAGYTPNDYPSEKEWSGRLKLERSLAIKCPNITYHLAGTKKIQQVLYDRAILDKYLPNKAEADTVFACFTDQYSLDPGANEQVRQRAYL
jgi:glutathione synthase